MRSISTPEGTTHYRIDGPAGAPLLVLSNSLGTSVAMWEPQMMAFTSHFRVLRYEHPGHGGTEASPGPYTIDRLCNGLLSLLDALGEERASICGLSLGGMVGMWVAAHAPDRVDRLVLCCTAPSLPPPKSWQERAARVRRGGTVPLVDGLMERWFTTGFSARGPEVVRQATNMIRSADPEGYSGCCEAIATIDLWDVLGEISAPTLIVAGREDPVVRLSDALMMHERISGASLVVLPGASHLANLEQPERFTDAVLDHLIGPQRERGMRARRAVLGDAHVDRAERTRTEFTAGFQDFITRYAWGEIWTRPGLDRRTRSCITLAMMVSLGHLDELRLHIRAAVTNGLSPDEIAEVLLQTAVYCGVPAANSAFAIAQETLREIGTDVPGAGEVID